VSDGSTATYKGIGDPRWHDLFDALAIAYRDLDPEKEITGLAISVRSNNGEFACEMTLGNTGWHRVTRPAARSARSAA
jgi:hypothetical protein